MKDVTGVIKTYYSFLRCLKSHRRKIAALQLSGKLEHWLVSEYVYHIYKVSGGGRFAITNTGKRNENERKIDLVVLGGELRAGRTRLYRDQATARALIEAKYFCNLRCMGFGSACDEIGPTIKSLSSQLYHYPEDSHGGFDVHLVGHGDVYGLIFASHVQTRGEGQEPIGGSPKDFLSDIYQRAKRDGLRYHDVKHPWLRNVFGRPQRITALGRMYQVSLYAGLWRMTKVKQHKKAMAASAA